MSAKITSKTGKTIDFLLSGEKKLSISPTSTITVTDAEADILIERLGSQIGVVYSADSKNVAVASATPTTNPLAALLAKK